MGQSSQGGRHDDCQAAGAYHSLGLVAGEKSFRREPPTRRVHQRRKTREAEAKARSHQRPGWISDARCMCVLPFQKGGGGFAGFLSWGQWLDHTWVIGQLGRFLGVFENTERGHRTRVFVMYVERLEPEGEWEESVRQRKWFPIREATELLRENKPNHAKYLEGLVLSRPV